MPPATSAVPVDVEGGRPTPAVSRPPSASGETMDRRRFPLKHLADKLGIVVGAPGVNSADGHPIGHGALAERLGIHIRTVRYYSRDGIPEASADRLAVKAGYLPWEIWPWYYHCGNLNCDRCPTPED